MWEYGFSDEVFVLVFQLVAWKIFGGICVALSECVFIKKEDFDIFILYYVAVHIILGVLLLCKRY